MGLSEQERKVLEELERGLYAEDPKLANRISNKGPKPQDANRTPAARMIAGALVALGGLGVILVGVIAHYTAIGVGGFLMTLVGLVIATSNRATPEGRSGTPLAGKSGSGTKPGSKKNKTKGPKQSLYEAFEERWDKRMNGEL